MSRMIMAVVNEASEGGVSEEGGGGEGPGAKIAVTYVVLIISALSMPCFYLQTLLPHYQEDL